MQCRPAGFWWRRASAWKLESGTQKRRTASVGTACQATADDLTQETFIKVSRALAKGTTPEHFRGWLYRIARNTTIDFFTGSRRFVPLEDLTVNREAGQSESYDFGDNEFRKQLFSYTLKVIEALPAEDREALTLTEVDGLSREELASELGISLFLLPPQNPGFTEPE